MQEVVNQLSKLDMSTNRILVIMLHSDETQLTRWSSQKVGFSPTHIDLCFALTTTCRHTPSICSLGTALPLSQ
jgi:hypothetical protein